MAINWSKAQTVVKKILDRGLVFGAGALLDPSVAHFVGQHQGVATTVAIVIAVLRAADAALGGKAAPAAKASEAPTA